MPTPTPIVIRTKLYSSYTKAAAALGVSVSIVRYYASRGRADEIGVLPGIHDGVSHPIVVHGVSYVSQAECAEALGVTISAVSHAVKRDRLDTLGERAILR